LRVPLQLAHRFAQVAEAVSQIGTETQHAIQLCRRHEQ
jgi:hypothetical protein